MVRKLQSRLTYANVMATLSLFIALGGASYAAIDVVGRNDIKSKHIKNGQVKVEDASKPAFGRGTVFGGIEFLNAGEVNAGYPPSGWNETVNGPTVAPVKLRIRDFRIQLSDPIASGARVHTLGTFFEGTADLRAGLSCEISAGEDFCTARGPSGIIRPGDYIQLVIRGDASYAPPAGAARVAFAWRAATP